LKPSYKSAIKGKRFLGVRFVNCNCYGRLYLNDEGLAYVGRCPRCGAPFHVHIGENGTDSRLFIAHC